MLQNLLNLKYRIVRGYTAFMDEFTLDQRAKISETDPELKAVLESEFRAENEEAAKKGAALAKLPPAPPISRTTPDTTLPFVPSSEDVASMNLLEKQIAAGVVDEDGDEIPFPYHEHRWTKGLLPGNKYIRICKYHSVILNRDCNVTEPSTREEFDRLPIK